MNKYCGTSQEELVIGFGKERVLGGIGVRLADRNAFDGSPTTSEREFMQVFEISTALLVIFVSFLSFSGQEPEVWTPSNTKHIVKFATFF